MRALLLAPLLSGCLEVPPLSLADGGPGGGDPVEDARVVSTWDGDYAISWEQTGGSCTDGPVAADQATLVNNKITFVSTGCSTDWIIETRGTWGSPASFVTDGHNLAFCATGLVFEKASPYAINFNTTSLTSTEIDTIRYSGGIIACTARYILRGDRL